MVNYLSEVNVEGYDLIQLSRECWYDYVGSGGMFLPITYSCSFVDCFHASLTAVISAFSFLSFPCLPLVSFRYVLLGRPSAPGYLPEDPESERMVAAKSTDQDLSSASPPQAYYTAPVLVNPDYQRHIANSGVESGVYESKEQWGQSQSQDSSQWKTSTVPLRSETDSSLPVVLALYDHEVCSHR